MGFNLGFKGLNNKLTDIGLCLCWSRS